MWTRLTELSDVDFAHIASLPGDIESPELAETIRLISGRDYAGLRAAVTSLGQLSLTTALEYGDRHHHWHHPSIELRLTTERKIHVSYTPGGERSPEPTAFCLLNTPSEAADYIDLLMIRMPYDTAQILQQVAEAKNRKAAYENKVPHQASHHERTPHTDAK